MKKSSKPEEHEDFLTLSLSTGHNPRPPTKAKPLIVSTSPSQSTPLPSLALFSIPDPPSPPHGPYNVYMAQLPSPKIPPASSGQSRPARTRRSPVQTLRRGKTETIPQPYPWATTKRATVHSLDHLLGNGINVVSGTVQCKKCEQSYEIEYDLRQKFMEMAAYISKQKGTMHDRAPSAWMNPTLPNCRLCEQSNCMKPVIAKKRSINWLFLLLGQMLGCCKLSELKYFCKHTKNHRTGAKDRVLYLTYLGLCKQLDPKGPYEYV